MRLLTAALFCFGVSLPALSTAQPAGDIALQLRRARQTAGVDYDAQLRRAELAYAAGDYAGVQATLSELSQQTFLESRAIELAYRAQLATGRDSLAAETLREGLATYPHAVRLQRLAPMAMALRGELTGADITAARRYPAALKYELRALLAFRQNLPTTALLEAERAAYLYTGGNSLAAETKQSVAAAYAHLLQVPASAPEPIGAPDLTFEEALGRAYAAAAFRLHSGGGLDSLSSLAAVAKLRAVALRLFVREGGLARWPDPMLVDLYVLDRAGHLETATALQLGWLAPAELLALEQAQPTRVLRARTYMAEDWRAAADAYAEGR